MGLLTHVAAANATTASIDTTGASLLVLVQGSGTDVTPTDSKSNVWTGATLVTGPDGGLLRVWYVNSSPIVGTGHTFTPGGTFHSCCVAAFSGFAVTDQQSAGASIQTKTIQPGSITPTQNGELIICAVGDDVDPGTIDSSFTITDQKSLVGGVNYGSALTFLIQTTAAAINPTWTGTAVQNLAAIQMSFKAIGTASPPSTLQFMGAG